MKHLLAIFVLAACALSVSAQITCGTSDDTSSVQAGINAVTSGVVQFPAGVCSINATGITGGANQVWQGVPGATILRLTANPNASMVTFGYVGDFSIRDIKFDYNNKTPPGNNATLAIVAASNFTIENCQFINQAKFGIALNAVTNARLRHLRIERSSTTTTQNQGILASTSSGDSTNIVLDDIYLKNTATDFSGSFITLDKVVVEGFGFGAGATFELDSCTHDIRIVNSQFSGGVGQDANGVYPSGVESWAPRTTITNSTAHGNSGSGFELGGKDSTVQNCVAFGNGVTNTQGSGIAMRYADSTHNSSGSIISGNQMHDSAGYGIVFQTSSITCVVMSANNFSGNGSGTTYLNGATVNGC